MSLKLKSLVFLILLVAEAFAFLSSPSGSDTTARIIGGNEFFASLSDETRVGIARSDLSTPMVSRRAWLVTAGASAAWLQAIPRANAATSLTTYSDIGFSIELPSSWEKTEQSLPDRRKIVLFTDPSDQGKTLFFAAFTPVRDDFTSLSSFGSVDQVARATILPKGELQGETTESKLISAESKKNAYYFDYTALPPNQPEVGDLLVRLALTGTDFVC
jgi:hypothetical protein